MSEQIEVVKYPVIHIGRLTIRIYGIDRKLRHAMHIKTFAIFKYHPCYCGCTKNPGIGFNFGWFGIGVEIKTTVDDRLAGM